MLAPAILFPSNFTVKLEILSKNATDPEIVTVFPTSTDWFAVGYEISTTGAFSGPSGKAHTAVAGSAVKYTEFSKVVRYLSYAACCNVFDNLFVMTYFVVVRPYF